MFRQARVVGRGLRRMRPRRRRTGPAHRWSASVGQQPRHHLPVACRDRLGLAMAGVQALAVLEPAQLLHRRHRDVRIGADAPGPAGVEVGAQREQAITQVVYPPQSDQSVWLSAEGGAAAFGNVQVWRMTPIW